MTVLRKIEQWLEDRTGLVSATKRSARHRVPAEVTSVKYGWWYVLGVATLTAFIVQLVTGVALATMYIPSAANAYESIEYITNEATFGNFLRGMHYIGASAMIVLVVFHMLRVFLTGSYKFPREVGWLSGVVLLFLTLAMAFTGMLLRWDQDSIGSVFVAVEQAGRAPILGDVLGRFLLAGETVSGTTLTRFFVLHVFLLPGLIIGLVGLHLYLVNRNGISEPPQEGRPVEPKSYRRDYHLMLSRTGRPYWPDAVWRELLFAGIVVLAIAGLALIIGPKTLTGPADPTNTGIEPQPDWYFIWYQAFLEVLPKSLGDLAILAAPTLALLVLFVLPFVGGKGERTVQKRPWAVAAVVLCGLSFAVLLVVGLSSPYVPAFNTERLTTAELGVEGAAAEDGYEVFFSNGCQYCHAVSGEGGSYGPDLTQVARRYSVGELRTIILRGRDDMPAYRRALTPEELNLLLTFLIEIDQSEQ